MSFEFLWYIPNQVTPGHRGEPATAGHNRLDTLTSQARALEDHGWKGALIGAGWGRPDTFTVATALAARTATFEPLIAVRPGYWHPANFAKAVPSSITGLSATARPAGQAPGGRWPAGRSRPR
jgi:alkanesulfonate monooxygenase